MGRKDRTDPTDPTDRSDLREAYSAWVDNPDPEIAANAVICLIHQANYLLDRQLAALERDFVEEGGYSERLAERRRERRRAPRC